MTDSTPRRRLVDILDGDADTLRKQWTETEAAQDFAVLPAGTYTAHVHRVELFNARTGTAGVKIQFRIADGEHTGRMLFHDCWLTPAALPQTKRDCTKLGLDSLDKLETANVEPGRIRCKVRVALRRDDDGTERNRVRGFDVLGIDEPQRDAFAPTDDAPAGPDNTPETATESAEPTVDADTSFDPAQLDAQLEADKAAAAASADSQAPTPSATGAAGDDGKPADPAALSRR